MIAATVSVPASALSLRTLINTATPEQILNTFSGRIAEINLQWAGSAGQTINITWRTGSTDFTENGHRLQEDRRLLTLRSPTDNQLNIDEIFVNGSGSMRILAYSI